MRDLDVGFRDDASADPGMGKEAGARDTSPGLTGERMQRLLLLTKEKRERERFREGSGEGKQRETADRGLRRAGDGDEVQQRRSHSLLMVAGSERNRGTGTRGSVGRSCGLMAGAMARCCSGPDGAALDPSSIKAREGR